MPFVLTRGTRQGCPLSHILFAISLEPLAFSIRLNSKIEGMSIGGKCFKLNMFAHDMVVYLGNPASSLPHLISAIDNFGSLSGFSINYNKSKLYPMALSNLDEEFLQSHSLGTFFMVSFGHPHSIRLKGSLCSQLYSSDN